MTTSILSGLIAEAEELNAQYTDAVESGFGLTAQAYWDEKCQWWDVNGVTILAALKDLLEQTTCDCGKPRHPGVCSGSCDNDE